MTDVCERAYELGLAMSYSTVWRRLHAHALRPRFHEQWLFPTDPHLLERAAPVLELYHGRWQGEPLRPTDAVLSADEITGLQALSREHAGTPPAAGRRARVEFEDERHGTLCYAAFLEVRTGRVFGKTSDGSTGSRRDGSSGHPRSGGKGRFLGKRSAQNGGVRWANRQSPTLAATVPGAARRPCRRA